MDSFEAHIGIKDRRSDTNDVRRITLEAFGACTRTLLLVEAISCSVKHKSVIASKMRK